MGKQEYERKRDQAGKDIPVTDPQTDPDKRLPGSDTDTTKKISDDRTKENDNNDERNNGEPVEEKSPALKTNLLTSKI